jgi:hypothetical protein
MKTHPIGSNRKSRKPRVLAFICLLALVIPACSSPISIFQSPIATPIPTGMVDVGGHRLFYSATFGAVQQ